MVSYKLDALSCHRTDTVKALNETQSTVAGQSHRSLIHCSTPQRSRTAAWMPAVQCQCHWWNKTNESSA